MNSLAAGSFAQVTFPFDTSNGDIGFLLDGTFSLSIKSKVLSGPGTFSVSVMRCQGGSGCPSNVPCNFTSSTMTAPSTAQTITASCTDAEATSRPTPGNVLVQITSNSQSEFLFDNVSFVKTSNQDSTNTTIFRDEFVNGLRNQFYAGRTGATLRLGPMIQNCETAANWLTTVNLAMNCTSLPAGTSGSDHVQLKDFEDLAKLLGAKPYWHTPCPATASDAVAEYNFSMTYGFPEQNISICNEAWNTSTGGQDIPGYAIYVPHAANIIRAIRASSSYSAASTVLIMNNQYQSNSGFMAAVAAVASSGGAPDGLEVSPYYGFPFTSAATPESMYRIGLSTSFIQTHNSSALLASVLASFKAQNIWGASGTAAPKIFTYEQADGDTSPCGSTGYPSCQTSATAAVDARNLQLLNVGAANGVVAAQESAELQLAGVAGTNLFALDLTAQSGTQALPSGLSGPNFQMYLWGATVDCGGSTAALAGLNCNPEPQMMGAQVGNYAVVGSVMTDCSTNAATYSQVAGPLPVYVPATSGVPYLACYSYSDGGTNRGILFVNNSTSSTYTVTIAGTSVPSGSFSGLQFAPASFASINVATATVPTYTQQIADTHATAPTMATLPLTLVAGSTVSVPPGVTSVVYSTVPSVSKQSTGSVVNSGAVSGLVLPSNPCIVLAEIWRSRRRPRINNLRVEHHRVEMGTLKYPLY